MRPRSDGTSSTAPAPGTLAIACRKASIWLDWISTKKNAGASLGMRRVIWSRRLPPISAVPTSTVSPRPNDSMTIGVGAPGRCRLASEAQGGELRFAGPRRNINACAECGKARKAPTEPSTKEGADALFDGGEDREQRQRHGRRQYQPVAPAQTRQPNRFFCGATAPRIKCRRHRPRARISGTSANKERHQHAEDPRRRGSDGIESMRAHRQEIGDQGLGGERQPTPSTTPTI